MKFLKTFKSKLLIVLIIMLALLTTISHAEIQPRTSPMESEDDEYGISLINEDSNMVVTNLEESKDTDLFLFENSVTIDYPVSGNIFVMAGNVTISSQVYGNVFALAQTVDVTSNASIHNDLFVCADTVNINGYVCDVYSASDKLTVSSNAQILRDLSATADSISLNGIINRNANLNFNTISIDESHAKIGGNLSYSSKSAFIPDSIVSGKVDYTEIKENNLKPTFSDIVKDYVEDAVKILIVALIVALILILATPKFAEKEYQILKNKPAQALVYGALALLAIPMACFILFFTIIGIIPAIIILLAYILLLQISSAIVAIPLSKMLCKKMNKESNGMLILMSILIVLVIFILEKLPILGSLISLFVALYGLGIITYAIFHAKTEIKDKNIVAEETVVVKPEKKNEQKTDTSIEEKKSLETKNAEEVTDNINKDIDNKKDSENK